MQHFPHIPRRRLALCRSQLGAILVTSQAGSQERLIIWGAPLTRAEGSVGRCSLGGSTRGELRCCSKIGTTRNTSTSCNLKNQKNQTKGWCKNLCDGGRTKLILHALLTTTVQTQHVCVCVWLYLCYMSKSRVKCYVWDEPKRVQKSIHTHTHHKQPLDTHILCLI